MTPIAVAIIDRAGEELGGFLPRLGGAIVLLVVGLLLARLAARLVRRALEGAGTDRLAERLGVNEVIERARLGSSISALTAGALRLGLVVVVVFAALSLLGLEFLSESLNAAILFLPNLLVAAALVLAGIVLGGLAQERVDRLTRQMDLPLPLGVAARAAVVGAFAITAAAQVAVSTAILMGLVAILLAAVGATFALAFGLGGQDVARELSAGRYLRGSYENGQEISVRGVRGEIVAIETAATVLRTPEGETVRVPNGTVLSSVVTVHSRPTGGAGPAPTGG